MKKVILVTILYILTNSGYAQEYKGLNGSLVVQDGTWTLTWQNNNFKFVTDWAHIVLNSKLEVEEFYNDFNQMIQLKSNDFIKKEKYIIYSRDNMVIIYNNNDQYTTMQKKYTKKGLIDIMESIKFMK